MAITVKDIREMDFNTVNTQGYDCDQVDDFLDEVANQLDATIAHDRDLTNRITALEAELAQAKADLAASEQARAEAEARKPEYDEEAYFKDLRNTIHDIVATARRNADQTTAEAARTAEEIKAEADAYAKRTTEEADEIAKDAMEKADKTLADLKAQSEELTEKNKQFRETFRKMVEDQLDFLNK